MNAGDFIRVAPDVVLGQRVKLFAFVNLYGCTIGDDTRIGTFVEIQKSAVIGKRQYMEQWTAGSHGGTFGGNPVSCAASMATLDVLEKTGVKFESERALELLEKSGCAVDREARIAKIPGWLVEECIRKTPSR